MSEGFGRVSKGLARTVGLAVLLMALLATAAYAAPGNLDPNFSGDGKALRGGDGVHDLDEFARPGGKLVALTGSGNLFRLDSNGAVDRSFGEGGYANTGLDTANDVEHLSDGKLVVAGEVDTSDGAGGVDFAVARFEADGSPDLSFGGGDGVVTTAFGPDSGPFDSANVLDIKKDGKIVVAGKSYRDSFSSDFAIARYHPDGTLDDSFGGDGTVTTDVGPRSNDDIRSITRQGGGGIVATGNTDKSPSGTKIAVVRYKSNGSVDQSFGGGDGVATIGFGTDSSDRASAMLVRPLGKLLVVGGSYKEGKGESLALVLFDRNGVKDTSFGNGNGKVLLEGYPGAEDAAAQYRNKLLVAGYGPTLARYNINGTPDKSFGGGDGIVSTDFKGYQFGSFQTVTVQTNGKPVAGGAVGTCDSDGFCGSSSALARYKAD